MGVWGDFFAAWFCLGYFGGFCWRFKHSLCIYFHPQTEEGFCTSTLKLPCAAVRMLCCQWAHSPCAGAQPASMLQQTTIPQGPALTDHRGSTSSQTPFTDPAKSLHYKQFLSFPETLLLFQHSTDSFGLDSYLNLTVQAQTLAHSKNTCIEFHMLTTGGRQ